MLSLFQSRHGLPATAILCFLPSLSFSSRTEERKRIDWSNAPGFDHLSHHHDISSSASKQPVSPQQDVETANKQRVPDILGFRCQWQWGEFIGNHSARKSLVCRLVWIKTLNPLFLNQECVTARVLCIIKICILFIIRTRLLGRSGLAWEDTVYKYI